MSVLTAKNIFGPLLDKRNLITIILVAVFFGVYRLSGGKVHSMTPAARDPLPGIENPIGRAKAGYIDPFSNSDDFSPSGDVQRLLSKSKGTSTNRGAQGDWRTKTESSRDLIEELAGGANNIQAKSPPLANNKSARSQSSSTRLDEIEKKLGVR